MAPTTSPPHVCPSVLPADFSGRGEKSRLLEKTGDGRILREVMDGSLVPGTAFAATAELTADGGALSRERDRMVDEVTTPRSLAAVAAPQDTQAYRLQENFEEAA